MADNGGLDWKTRAFIVGGVLGALVGVGAAYLLVRASADREEPPAIPASKAVTLGVTVLGLLKQIASLGED